MHCGIYHHRADDVKIIATTIDLRNRKQINNFTPAVPRVHLQVLELCFALLHYNAIGHF